MYQSDVGRRRVSDSDCVGALSLSLSLVRACGCSSASSYRRSASDSISLLTSRISVTEFHFEQLNLHFGHEYTAAVLRLDPDALETQSIGTYRFVSCAFLERSGELWIAHRFQR